MLVLARLRSSVGLALLLAACGPRVDTSWQQGDGYRWRALDVPRRGSPGFTLMDPSRSGITFANTVSDSLLRRNRILAQGAGTCLGDVDGDGLADLFLARTEGPNALYRNLGDWRFEDFTQRAGVAAADRYSTGCALADVDGDADLDAGLTYVNTPLMMAAIQGHHRTAVSLLRHGANARIRVRGGHTAAEFAEKYNHYALARALRCAEQLAPGTAFSDRCERGQALDH